LRAGLQRTSPVTQASTRWAAPSRALKLEAVSRRACGTIPAQTASRWRKSRRIAKAMKTSSILGIVLIVLGLFALAYHGINYTKREKVADIGPLHAEKDTTKTIPLPPILGGLSLVCGVVLVAAGAKKS
jgi:hypothetical protein